MAESSTFSRRQLERASRKLWAQYPTSAPSGKRMLLAIMQTGSSWTTGLPEVPPILTPTASLSPFLVGTSRLPVPMSPSYLSALVLQRSKSVVPPWQARSGNPVMEVLLPLQ